MIFNTESQSEEGEDFLNSLDENYE